MKLSRSLEPQQLPASLKKAGLALLIFLCLFIPFRTPLSDLTFSGVKAIPDVLIVCLAAWYAVAVRFRLRFTIHDVLFLAFEAVAFISTVFINDLGIGLFLYQTRAIGIYYVLYFVLRNFGFGQKELVPITRTLQAASVPLFVLGVIEKVFSKCILFDTDFASGLDRINYARVYSMFYNPNTYGLFLVFTILLSLVIWYLEGKKTPLWLYCVLAISLYMTMSRSSMAILALVLAALFLLIWKGKKVEIQWKKLILWCACMGASALIVSSAAGYAAQLYFNTYGKDAVVEKLSGTQANAVIKVKYLNPQGEECVGYAFYGITYTDIGCTQPLKEYGSIVFVDNKQYVLTHEGGKLLEEFQALSAEEQAALLDQDVDREGAKRENSIIQNIEDSLQVDTTDRFDEIGDDKLYTKENNGRLFAVDLAFRIWKDYPVFGTGYGTFGTSASLTWVPDIYYDYDMLEGFYADNQFACVLVETGAVGFVLFMAFLLSTLWFHRKHLLKVVVCVIIAWFGAFYNILEIQIGAMLLWTLLSFDLGQLTPRDLLNK